jgi:ketosteroid isomerase-like protein
MNRNDIGVVEVENENDYTVVRADITFLASALLGGVPQDDLVRSKLDRVLDRVKMELGTKTVRGETLPVLDAVPHDDENSHRIEESPEIFAEPEVVTAQKVEAEPEIVAVQAMEAVPAAVAEDVVEAEPASVVEHEERVSEPVYADEAAVVESESVPEPVVPEPVMEAVAVEAEPVTTVRDGIEAPVAQVVTEPIVFVTDASPHDSEPVAISEVSRRVEPTSQSGERKAVPLFQSFQEEDEKKPRSWGLLATLLCMLAAVALFLAWPYLVGLVHDRFAPAASASVSEESTADQAVKAPEDKTPIPVPDANAAAVRDAAIHNESDPRVWLESWAEALRGQDAAAQASFYSDPVEHYALKSNVSNADVWLDKKNAIQGRPKLWTVKLEDVTLEPRPDESLRVRLTKHFVSQSDGGKVSEQSIRSQLKLRKIDGQWKITSEQNLAITK